MSSTAHQREVRDLLAAGLNPMLSVNGGASTPTVSAATVQPEDALGRSISSAGDKAREAAMGFLDYQNALSTIRGKEIENSIGKQRVRQETITADIMAAGSAAKQATAGATAETELQLLKQELHNAVKSGDLTEAQRKQIEHMLPELVRKAKADANIREYETPSAKAEGEVWEQLGSAGKGTALGSKALQQLILMYKSQRGK